MNSGKEGVANNNNMVIINITIIIIINDNCNPKFYNTCPMETPMRTTITEDIKNILCCQGPSCYALRIFGWLLSEIRMENPT